MMEKIRQIKLLVLDVDGVLTTGMIYYGDPEIQMRGFHILDGLGIQLLQKSGIEVAVISGKKSDAVARRLRELEIKHIYLGHEKKLPAYEELRQARQLSYEEIACMGDDLPDFPLLSLSGIKITVPHAPSLLKQIADYTTKNKGGNGAVREACEWLMQGQGTWEPMVKSCFS